MNKQELLEKIVKLDIEVSENFPHYDLVGKGVVLALINQLDEPQKPIIPQFIANWIESYRKKTLVELINDAVYSSDEDSQCFRRWFHEEMGFESNYDEFLSRVWLDGYEVERKNTYEVIIGKGTLCGYPSLVVLYKSVVGTMVLREMTEEDYEDSKRRVPTSFWLTDKEIEGYDERFWTFAQEVVE